MTTTAVTKMKWPKLECWLLFNQIYTRSGRIPKRITFGDCWCCYWSRCHSCHPTNSAL